MTARSVPVVALLLSLGCSSITSSDADEGPCPQAGEFRIFGCARVAGRVTGPEGEPARLTVGVRKLPDGPGVYTEPFEVTDPKGEYSLKIQRMFPESLPGDTVTMQLIWNSTVQSGSVVGGTLPVLLRFGAVDEPAPVTRIDFSTEIPATE